MRALQTSNQAWLSSGRRGRAERCKRGAGRPARQGALACGAVHRARGGWGDAVERSSSALRFDQVGRRCCRHCRTGRARTGPRRRVLAREPPWMKLNRPPGGARPRGRWRCRRPRTPASRAATSAIGPGGAVGVPGLGVELAAQRVQAVQALQHAGDAAEQARPMTGLGGAGVHALELGAPLGLDLARGADLRRARLGEALAHRTQVQIGEPALALQLVHQARAHVHQGGGEGQALQVISRSAWRPGKSGPFSSFPCDGTSLKGATACGARLPLMRSSASNPLPTGVAPGRWRQGVPRLLGHALHQIEITRPMAAGARSLASRDHPRAAMTDAVPRPGWHCRRRRIACAVRPGRALLVGTGVAHALAWRWAGARHPIWAPAVAFRARIRPVPSWPLVRWAHAAHAGGRGGALHAVGRTIDDAAGEADNRQAAGPGLPGRPALARWRAGRRRLQVPVRCTAAT